MTSSTPKLPLDAEFYALADDETAFFKSQTGIQSDEELKQHIIAIQTKAYEVHPYPCIRRFAFTTLKISRLPAYDQLLKLGLERPGAIFLDIGCCFGNDARKAIADGFPSENVIASDLRQDFWDLGHELFKSTPETFPVPFIAGDAFDPAHIAIVPPVYEPTESTAPPLNTLTSLNPLHGQISAIHASAFFHLFDEAQQFQLAQALASLLSPLPGSVIFGAHGGKPVPSYRTEAPSSHGGFKFCHSPDSWIELWDGNVFKKGTVKVEARLEERDRKDLARIATPGAKFYLLVWSVTRL